MNFYGIGICLKDLAPYNLIMVIMFKNKLSFEKSKPKYYLYLSIITLN